jgi:hypothetical protein
LIGKFKSEVASPYVLMKPWGDFSIVRSLLTGNAADLEAELSGFLCAMASFYDTGAKESFYHGWCWACWPR